MSESTVTHLSTENGTTTSLARDKVDFLDRHFSRKMTDHDAFNPPPSSVLPRAKLSSITTTKGEVRATLSSLDETKTSGNDKGSSRALERCSEDEANHLSQSFETIQRHNCGRPMTLSQGTERAADLNQQTSGLLPCVQWCARYSRG